MSAFTIERFESLVSRLEEFESGGGFLKTVRSHLSQVRIDTEGLLKYDPTNSTALEARAHAEQQDAAYTAAYTQLHADFFQELIDGRSTVTLEVSRDSGRTDHYQLACWVGGTKVNHNQALQVLSALSLCEVRSGEVTPPQADQRDPLYPIIQKTRLVIPCSTDSDYPSTLWVTTEALGGKLANGTLVAYGLRKDGNRFPLSPTVEEKILATLSDTFKPRVGDFTVKYVPGELLPPIGHWKPAIVVDVEPNR